MPEKIATQIPTPEPPVWIWPLILITGLFAGILLENWVLSRFAPDLSRIASESNESTLPVAAVVPNGSSTTAPQSPADGAPEQQKSERQGSERTPDGTPQLVVDEREFNFGDRERGELVQHTFVIRNPGTAPLKIDRHPRSDCGCVRSRLAAEIVPPGGSTTLAISLSLEAQQGPMQHTVFVKSNDPQNPKYALTIAGTATSRVQLDPRDLRFENIPANRPASKTVDVNAIDGLTFKVKGTKTSGQELSAQVETIEDGKQFRVTITLQPPPAISSFQGWVQLLTDHPGEYATIGIPVTAKISDPSDEKSE